MGGGSFEASNITSRDYIPSSYSQAPKFGV